MPRSWQARTSRTAASPRLAISTRESIRLGLELEERLPELDGLRVVHEDRPDHARLLRLELVEQLHRLEHAEGLANLDPVALLDERLCGGRRRAVEGSHHRRLDLDQLGDGGAA